MAWEQETGIRVGARWAPAIRQGTEGTELWALLPWEQGWRLTPSPCDQATGSFSSWHSRGGCKWQPQGNNPAAGGSWSCSFREEVPSEMSLQWPRESPSDADATGLRSGRGEHLPPVCRQHVPLPRGAQGWLPRTQPSPGAEWGQREEP